MCAEVPCPRFPDAATLVAAADHEAPLSPVLRAWCLRNSQPRAAQALAQAALSQAGDPIDAADRIRLELVLAEAALHLGQPDEARRWLDISLQALHRSSLPLCHADALWIEANWAHDQGDRVLRTVALRGAIEMARSARDPQRERLGQLLLAVFDAAERREGFASQWDAQVRPNLDAPEASERCLAHFYCFLAADAQGDAAGALSHALQSRAAAQECGMTRRALMDAANIGAIYDDLGELGAALEILEPAVREARAHGAPYPLATCLYTLAAVLLKQGRAALALAMGREAVALLSHCPGSPHYVSALQVLGAVALRLEDWPAAQEVFDTSLSLRRNPLAPPTAHGHAHVGLARLHHRNGRPAQAQHHLMCVLESDPRQVEPATRIEALTLQAEVLAAQGHPQADAEAVRCLEQALAEQGRLGGAGGRPPLLEALSAQLARQGRTGEALARLQEALAARQEEQARSASRHAQALEVRLRTEQALAEAQTHRLAAQAQQARAEELDRLNQALRRTLDELHDTQQRLLERNEALERANAEIRELSLTDPLTGLRNRRYLTEVIEALAAQALRPYRAGTGPVRGHPGDLAFLMVDMDHFKAVNDAHGHSAGDAVLVQFAQRLRTLTRQQDFLFRWGGEEFLILLRGIPREEVPLIAERLRHAVAEQPFHLGPGQALSRTASIGHASFPVDPDAPLALNWQQAIDLADSRLFEAKRLGRNRCVG